MIELYPFMTSSIGNDLASPSAAYIPIIVRQRLWFFHRLVIYLPHIRYNVSGFNVCSPLKAAPALARFPNLPCYILI
jgi:hypothetical protein